MKSPAFQFYPKQWLGDDKVLAMDWNARAMHMHLMCIAWQQSPPCTLPDDDGMIRRWLGNPKRWEALKIQILAAWKMVDGRWLQSGLLTEFEKQAAYRESRKSGSNARWKDHAHASEMECITDALLFPSSITSTKPLEATPLPGPRPEEFANVWNAGRGPLPKVETFTDGRRKKVIARIRSGVTLERFTQAVECCRTKPFLMGDNDRGWTATFDWLIANGENIEKSILNPYSGPTVRGPRQTAKEAKRKAFMEAPSA